MARPKGTLIEQTDLENAISPRTVVELFNDSKSGVADEGPVQAVINRAEAAVYSYLARAFPDITQPFAFSQTGSFLLKDAALQFAIPFSFLRHPEYVRTFGDNPRGESMLTAAHKNMERLCTGKQYLFDVVTPSGINKPKSVATGGMLYDNGPRTIIDNIDGTRNGGDL